MCVCEREEVGRSVGRQGEGKKERGVEEGARERREEGGKREEGGGGGRGEGGGCNGERVCVSVREKKSERERE